MDHVGLLMPHRVIDRHDRTNLVAVGLWALTLCALMVADRTAWNELWAPWAWPTLLLVAGMLALAWAAYPASERLRAGSGAAMVSGLGGRGWALVHGLLVGTNEVSLLRVGLGIALWSMLAFAMLLLWRRLLPAPGH